MEAGSELDLRIAEEVLGWAGTVVPARQLSSEHQTIARVEVPPYSTDIESAWKVVDHLEINRIGRLELVRLDWGLNLDLWRATFFPGAFQGRASTAPLAICLAALKAVEALPDK